MEEGERRAGRLKEKTREKEEEMSDRLRSVFLCLKFSVGGVGTVEDVVRMERNRGKKLSCRTRDALKREERGHIVGAGGLGRGRIE